jgi:glycyl-tRNA synthetase
MTDQKDMERIVSWAKRRGFIFPSSEIYGGTGNVWDYGPLGVLLKNNLKKLWWDDIVTKRDDIVGLDAAILMNRKVWQASGHEKGFIDLMVECQKCHKRFKKDDIAENACPECGGKLMNPREFNLMFKTFMGPVERDSSQTYLRPETAQGIFVNFKNVLASARLKIPFGIAQIGKSFRNEITPGNFTFRTREFEQMELEYFVQPSNAAKWYKYWVGERLEWYKKIGLSKENLRTRRHQKKELAHYAVSSTDIEYKFPFGWAELEGVANRQDYDLKMHQKYSKKDLEYFEETTRKRYLPYIIEPSGGIDRTILALIVDSFQEIKGGRGQAGAEEEVVLKINPKLSPIKVAVFPLVNKDKLPKIAKEIYDNLKICWPVEYDDVASIGRRYRRQDEIGTPYCVTVDFDSLKDKKVTVRDRDSMKQERIKIDDLSQYIWKKIES